MNPAGNNAVEADAAGQTDVRLTVVGRTPLLTPAELRAALDVMHHPSTLEAVR